MKHQKSRGVERNLMDIHIKCFITTLRKILIMKNPYPKNKGPCLDD